MAFISNIKYAFQKWPLAFASVIVLLGMAISRPVFAEQTVTQALSAPGDTAETSARSKILQAQTLPHTSQSQEPLDKPNMDQSQLLAWAAASASDIMTFSYTDYPEHLQQSSRYFTKTGWETFTVFLLQPSPIVKDMTIGARTSQSQTFTAHPQGAPIITEEGTEDGKYHWLVKLRLSVSYEMQPKGGATMRVPVSLPFIVLRIERVAALENPDGIGISEWTTTNDPPKLAPDLANPPASSTLQPGPPLTHEQEIEINKIKQQQGLPTNKPIVTVKGMSVSDPSDMLVLPDLRHTTPDELAEFTEKAAYGDTDAQLRLGGLYIAGIIVKQDYSEAYFWESLAVHSGDSSGRDKAAYWRNQAAHHLTAEQRAALDKRVKEWKPSEQKP